MFTARLQALDVYRRGKYLEAMTANGLVQREMMEYEIKKFWRGFELERMGEQVVVMEIVEKKVVGRGWNVMNIVATKARQDWRDKKSELQDVMEKLKESREKGEMARSEVDTRMNDWEAVGLEEEELLERVRLRAGAD